MLSLLVLYSCYVIKMPAYPVFFGVSLWKMYRWKPHPKAQDCFIKLIFPVISLLITNHSPYVSTLHILTCLNRDYINHICPSWGNRTNTQNESKLSEGNWCYLDILANVKCQMKESAQHAFQLTLQYGSNSY